jgi:hypothetical protein
VHPARAMIDSTASSLSASNSFMTFSQPLRYGLRLSRRKQLPVG